MDLAHKIEELLIMDQSFDLGENSNFQFKGIQRSYAMANEFQPMTEGDYIAKLIKKVQRLINLEF